MDNVVSVRLDDAQIKLLDRLCESTGWNVSQVIRYLLENANIRPASVFVEVPAKQEKPVTANTTAVNG